MALALPLEGGFAYSDQGLLPGSPRVKALADFKSLKLNFGIDLH
jgi:hypothetical protein